MYRSIAWIVMVVGLFPSVAGAKTLCVQFDSNGDVLVLKGIGRGSKPVSAYLADYQTVRLEVELSAADRQEYKSERAIYLGFLAAQGIRMGTPSGWSDFIIRSSRSAEGQRAMAAYRRQREIAFAAPAKLDYVEHLLARHREDRVLLFTDDNATAYTVSRRFLVPAITHQTKVRERSDILTGLARGRYGAVVTSKVLNEGVDIPAASVAIVISGSGAVREHVQRLGRILRKSGDKEATLYEVVTKGTVEEFSSNRRRQHSADAAGTDHSDSGHHSSPFVPVPEARVPDGVRAQPRVYVDRSPCNPGTPRCDVTRTTPCG